jgi:uncharacterized protein YodC (DUF2158 family)
MDQQFKPGDAVQLKSGASPVMVIEDIAKYGMGATRESAKCVWFDGPNRKEGLFELYMLTKA